jgi:hypothetical protein
MGTSIAGAGSGSGGYGGGGGAGYLKLDARGNLVSVDPEESEARAAIQGVFSKLSSETIAFALSDPGVRAAYEALHRMRFILIQGDRSWSGVASEFGVHSGPGCLKALVAALTRDEGPHPVAAQLQAPLTSALTEFFQRIVSDDPLVVESGDGADVMKHLDAKPFNSISAYFLGDYLSEWLRSEDSLSARARKRLWDFSHEKANQLVAAFKDKFYGKAWKKIDQVSYSHLFQIMEGESAWVTQQLRKELRPR